MQKPVPEQEILEVLAHGGPAAEAALRRVYFDNRTGIGAFIRRNRGTEEEAKDVVQEAVIAFYENVKKGKFRGESAISTYLFSIARFIWLNQLKRKQLETKSLVAIAPGNYGPELPRHLAEGEAQQQMLELFGRLGDDCRRVLMDAVYHDFSMKEIATTMGYENEQVARNKKYGCMKKLKELLVSNPAIFQQLKPS